VLEVVDSTLGRLRGIPGIRKVALVDRLALGTARNPTRVAHAEDPTPQHRASFARVDGSYFDLIGTPIVAGRPILDSDRLGNEFAAVVSRFTAERLWGEPQLAVGATLLLDDRRTTVVGVAENTDVRNLAEGPAHFVYVSIRQDPANELKFLTTIDGAVGAPLAGVVTALESVEGQIVLVDQETISQYLDRWLMPGRVRAAVLSVLGAATLVLALAGVAATARATAGERVAEMGIRSALGATPGQLLRLVVRDAASAAGLGLAGAVAASYFVFESLARIGVDVPDFSIRTTGVVLCALGFAAVLASAGGGLRIRRARGIAS